MMLPAALQTVHQASVLIKPFFFNDLLTVVKLIVT